MSEHKLDARRLLCPMPVIRTQDAVANLAVGDTLEITCSDPGALNDIPAWCRINGHRVLETKTINDEIIITIEVAGSGT